MVARVNELSFITGVHRLPLHENHADRRVDELVDEMSPVGVVQQEQVSPLTGLDRAIHFRFLNGSYWCAVVGESKTQTRGDNTRSIDGGGNERFLQCHSHHGAGQIHDERHRDAVLSSSSSGAKGMLAC